MFSSINYYDDQCCQAHTYNTLSKTTALGTNSSFQEAKGLHFIQVVTSYQSNSIPWPYHQPCSLYGVQINLLTSTSRPPRPAAFRWRSRTFGSAQMTCCPFLYCINSRFCRVLKISSALMAVMSLNSYRRARIQH